MMQNGARRALLVITQSEMGGAQHYVLMLATGLRDHGWQPVVACGGDGPLIDILRARGIEVRVVPSLVRPIRPWTDIKAVKELYRFIKERRFEVVHCNSTKAGIVGRIAARLARVPMVFFTVHGCVLNEPMTRPSFLLYWGLEWITARMSTLLIAVSNLDRDTLLRYRLAQANKIAVVPNGIDPGKEPASSRKARSPLLRTQLGIPQDVTVIGTTANFYPTKALDVLIRAAASIATRRPDMRVVIIGDGMERPALERLIVELGLEHHVILAGQLPNARNLLPAFDLFVLSSRKEGMPIALLEAMADGLPVVVTDVGGMPDVVEHGRSGLVVPRENPTALASAVLSLLENPGVATQYGNAARARVISSFTEQRMVIETINLYLDHLPSSSTRRRPSYRLDLLRSGMFLNSPLIARRDMVRSASSREPVDHRPRHHRKCRPRGSMHADESSTHMRGSLDSRMGLHEAEIDDQWSSNEVR